MSPTRLILPIILSAVALFLASFSIRMGTPLHDGDYAKLPNEQEVMQAAEQIPGGRYVFPWASRAEYGSEEFLQRYVEGPRGMMVVYDEPMNFPATLGLTFVFYLVAGMFVAYLAYKAIPVGAAFAEVFKFTAIAAIAIHGLGWLPQLIWYGDIALVPTMIDCVVFALLTGVVFGLLWHRPKSPEAAPA